MLGQPRRDLEEELQRQQDLWCTGGHRGGRWSELDPPHNGGTLGDDLPLCLCFLLIPLPGADVAVE